MKRICIIGANGSMGKRYQAILNHLGYEFFNVDTHNLDGLPIAIRDSDGVIIAAPTDFHGEYIEYLSQFNKPILCEKPISKNIYEVRDLMKVIQDSRAPFRMVYQYSMLPLDQRCKGGTYYNYFRHGNDGLAWDCIQIIGLATGPIELAETSPIWTCAINGYPVFIKHMDHAYVSYVEKWLSSPDQDRNEILDIHEKTYAYANQLR